MNSICILDFETTGLMPTSDEIIECALKIYEKPIVYSTLVKPDHVGKAPPGYHGAYILPKITEITGITNQMIHKQGICQEMLAKQMYEFFKKNGVKYIVAHNGEGFDFILLKLLFLKYNYDFTQFLYIDTMYLFKRIFQKMGIKCKSFSQKNLCELFRIHQENAHRALGDVEDLEQLVYHMVTEYGLHFETYIHYNYPEIYKLSEGERVSDNVLVYISHLFELCDSEHTYLQIQQISGRMRSMLYNFVEKNKLHLFHESGNNIVKFYK